MNYTTRTTQISIMPIDEPIFSERCTRVTIEDEGGGEFVSVQQLKERGHDQQITIDPEEWPVLMAAIERMVSECKPLK
jgi:hypothetical protein